MSNQWFYINRWRQNREASWVVVDKFGKIIRDKDNKIIKVPGKFKYLKAVGWYIDEYRQAQVSMNLIN